MSPFGPVLSMKTEPKLARTFADDPMSFKVTLPFVLAAAIGKQKLSAAAQTGVSPEMFRGKIVMIATIIVVEDVRGASALFDVLILGVALLVLRHEGWQGRRAALLNLDTAWVSVALLTDQHDFGSSQLRPRAQDNGSSRRVDSRAKVNIVPPLAIKHHRSATNHKTIDIHGAQVRGMHGDIAVCCLPAIGKQLDPAIIGYGDGHRAAEATFGSLTQYVAIKTEAYFPIRVVTQGQFQGLGISLQHAPWYTLARRIGLYEVGIAHFVVLRVAAQHIGRGQNQPTGHTVANTGTGNRQHAGGRPGTIAQGVGRGYRSLPGQTIEFDPIGTGQQCIGGGHQGIGARCQAWHSGTNGHLLAQQGVRRTRFATCRRRHRLYPRHNGIHRVGRQAGQGKAVCAVLHQRIKARVGRAAPTRDKGCP